MCERVEGELHVVGEHVSVVLARLDEPELEQDGQGGACLTTGSLLVGATAVNVV